MPEPGEDRGDPNLSTQTPGTPTALLGTEPTLLCSVVSHCRTEPTPGVQGSLQVLMDFGTKLWGVWSNGEGDHRVLCWGGGMPAAPTPCSPSAPLVLFLP